MRRRVSGRTFLRLRTGADMRSTRPRSSFGKGARAACTTGCATPGKRMAAGRSSVSRRSCVDMLSTARHPTGMQFANVTAIAKANIYFDGDVVSHGLLFPDGSKKTLGLI